MLITKGKTNIKYLFIVTIFAVFAGGIMIGAFEIIKCPYWWPSYQQTTIVKDETADWKTYTNDLWGIEFKYPKNYILKEALPSTILYFLKEEQVERENDYTFEISISPFYSFSLKDFANSDEFITNHVFGSCASDGVGAGACSIYCDKIVTQNEFTTQNGFKGYEFYLNKVTKCFSSEQPTQETTTGPIFALDVFQQSNNKIWSAYFFTLKGEKNKELLKQIISTFKLVK